MFPHNYFAALYFAPLYFPPLTEVITLPGWSPTVSASTVWTQVTPPVTTWT